MARLNVGFVDGMQVCVLEEGVLRDGEVTSVSAKDGVTVRFADGNEEDNYVPTKLKKMIADGVVAAREKAAKVSFLFFFTFFSFFFWTQFTCRLPAP